jgi:hypothetical protein
LHEAIGTLKYAAVFPTSLYEQRTFAAAAIGVGRSLPDIPFEQGTQHRRLRMRVAFPRARVVFKVARFRAPKKRSGGLCSSAPLRGACGNL